MTTEITIDDRLAVRVKEIADASHISFAQAVERAIFVGLPYLAKSDHTKPQKVENELDKANAALKQILEDEDLERYRHAGG
jgi:hypothetical protein